MAVPDFVLNVRRGTPLKVHDNVALAASGSDAKTVGAAPKPFTAGSLHYKKESGSGTHRVKLFGRSSSGIEVQIGSDGTAASGRIDLPAGAAFTELKVEIAETGGSNGVNVTTELCAA